MGACSDEDASRGGPSCAGVQPRRCMQGRFQAAAAFILRPDHAGFRREWFEGDRIHAWGGEAEEGGVAELAGTQRFGERKGALGKEFGHGVIFPGLTKMIVIHKI
ncbi:hypothetical protein TRIUR3_29001 [Triticum urartu]|uniref:Uncharacterized protein n=1 Tax=Triticum urartu TaxID=4572 RepID=M8A155_TRIUA|nr:hypothetical protein TRIUR3_29001 [Triticum urartu]